MSKKNRRKRRKEKNQKYPQIALKNEPPKTTRCRGEREGNLCFEFPEGWRVTKYDTWEFIGGNKTKNPLGFTGIKDKGVQSVDFICIDNTNSTLWLIEVKDFREGDGKGHGHLRDSLSNKLLCSMSGLFAARYAAKNQYEKEFATATTATQNLRFVLHLETPIATNSLEKSCIDRSEIQLFIEQRFSRITSNPIVTSIEDTQDLPWIVTDMTA